MLKYFLIAIAVTSFTHDSMGEETCLHKRCFDNEYQVNNVSFKLNGVGLFEFLKKDLYTMAFYVDEQVSSIEQALADRPKALIIEYHTSIRVSWMNRAAEKVLIKNPDVDFESIQERFTKIGNSYQKVKEGERYELRYLPNEGTSLWLNGKYITSIPGYDFAKAYFGIWLSEYPANKKLRNNLIGAKDDA